jgi:hypothetical protein
MGRTNELVGFFLPSFFFLFGVIISATQMYLGPSVPHQFDIEII